MTERHNEQSNNPYAWPLSPEEVALAKKERDERRLKEERDMQRRAEGLAAMEKMLGLDGYSPNIDKPLVAPAPAYLYPTPNEHSDATLNEDTPKVISRNITVDGKPVYISAEATNEQRKAYIQDKQDRGLEVEFELIDPQDDATSFRGEDQLKLAAVLAAERESVSEGPSAKSLPQRIGIEDVEDSLPLQKKRLDFVKSRKAMGVGLTALVAVSLAGGAFVLSKPGGDNDNSAANVAGPDVVNASTEKEIDVQALISDCAPDKIGTTVASGTVSVDAGVIWNIPGGKEQFPKLSLGAWDHDNNPATAPANEPRFLPLTANSITVSMAVCDAADKPAAALKDGVLHINFSEASPQIAFEAGEKNAPELSALTQEDLNKLVAKQWMDQEAANTLRRNMTDPNMAIAATKETLHGVVEQMKQPDNKTGLAVVAALKAQLRAAIAKQLPAKADGKPYEIVDEGELSNGRITGIGVDVAKNDAYSIDAPRITAQKINEPASKAK